eukprot:7099491-Alexandrium_andersonii.AAC.1
MARARAWYNPQAVNLLDCLDGACAVDSGRPASLNACSPERHADWPVMGDDEVREPTRSCMIFGEGERVS